MFKLYLLRLVLLFITYFITCNIIADLNSFFFHLMVCVFLKYFMIEIERWSNSGLPSYIREALSYSTFCTTLLIVKCSKHLHCPYSLLIKEKLQQCLTYNTSVLFQTLWLRDKELSFKWDSRFIDHTIWKNI